MHSYTGHFFLLLMLTLPKPSMGEGVNEIFIAGVGARSCKQFIEATERDRSGPGTGDGLSSDRFSSALVVEWMSGYVTAINRMSKPGGRQIKTLGNERLVQELEIECGKTPTSRIAIAVKAVTDKAIEGAE